MRLQLLRSHTHTTHTPNAVSKWSPSPTQAALQLKNQRKGDAMSNSRIYNILIIKEKADVKHPVQRGTIPMRTCGMKPGEANGELRNRRQEQHELTLGEETLEHVWAPPQLNTLTHDKAMASTASARFYFPNCKGFLYKESCKITKSLSVLKTRSPIKQK